LKGRDEFGDKHRWEDNIKIDIKEIGHLVVEWIYLTQDWVQWWTLINMIINLWVS
jgi:hypothetical protein